jgi:uracil-DNA glycosylase
MVCQFLFKPNMVGILLVPVNLQQYLPQPWLKIVDLDLLKSIENQLDEDFLPAPRNVFRALTLSPEKVKVLIVGQDPYPNADHAMGLAFSVNKTVSVLPASLKNIFKELESDLGVVRTNGDLSDWVNQGVLLLNTTLTFNPTQPRQHLNIGWDLFTKSIIEYAGKNGAIGVLWGNHAIAMKDFFLPDRVITSVHPSPLSAYKGFFDSKPFSRVNQILIEQGISEIKW